VLTPAVFLRIEWNVVRVLNQYWRITLFIIALLLVFWFVWTLLNVLLPFILGLIFAYLLLPVMQWIEKKLPGKARWSSTKRILLIIFIYLLVVAALGLVLFFTIPQIITSATDFFTNLPKIIPDFISRLQSWTSSIRQHIPDQIRSQVDTYISNLASNIGSGVQAGLLAGLTFFVSSFGFLLGFVSLPVFLFFLLKDAESLTQGFYSSLPLWLREHVQGVVKILRDILGRYIRSEIILGIAVAVLDFIGLMILGIPYAPALAFWAGLTELVPVLGPWIGGAAGVIVTLATDVNKTIWVIILYAVVQILEGNVLVPRIHSQFLRIPPAVILILLVLGGHFAGLWGVILVVPLAATFVALYKYLVRSIKEENKAVR
jgi:predicted PurR-regulated permease PerM